MKCLLYYYYIVIERYWCATSNCFLQLCIIYYIVANIKLSGLTHPPCWAPAQIIFRLDLKATGKRLSDEVMLALLTGLAWSLQLQQFHQKSSWGRIFTVSERDTCAVAPDTFMSLCQNTSVAAYPDGCVDNKQGILDLLGLASGSLCLEAHCSLLCSSLK